MDNFNPKSVIVLQSTQYEHFSTFIRRKAFYRNGTAAMKSAEGKDSIAYIIPTPLVYKELGGRNNVDALIARGIRVVKNETGEDAYCPIGDIYFPWDYKYEFDKIERIPYNYLAIAVGDIYKHRKMRKGGNNFYLNNPNHVIVDKGKDVVRRAAKKKK